MQKPFLRTIHIMEKKESTKKSLYKHIAVHAASIAVIVFGAMLLSAGFSLFLVPLNVAPGGFGGLAALISHLFWESAGVELPVGLLTLLLNIPLYLIAFKKLGNKHGIYSILGVLLYSLFIDLFAMVYPHLELEQIDSMLSIVYGGVLSGIGLGLIIKMGATTGGSDMLAIIIVSKIKWVSVGTVLLIVDAAVVAMSIFIYDLTSALYAFIAIFLTTVLVDYVVEGTRSAKAYYIITDKAEDISFSIFEVIGRGATLFPAKGMYTRSDKDVLLCIVTRTQIAELKSIVKHTDPFAFMFSTSVKEVIGEGFMAEKPYVPPPGRKKKR